MSISHTPAAIIITDDQNPNREPLILAPNASPQQIAAALLAYLGPERLRQPPDYIKFYNALIASSVYANVLSVPATADLARAMAVFVSAIQDCMADRENRNAMQAAIWLLLPELPLDLAHAAELQGLMIEYHLAEIYSLQPPPPES
jgi:hypothetical protein